MVIRASRPQSARRGSGPNVMSLNCQSPQRLRQFSLLVVLNHDGKDAMEEGTLEFSSLGEQRVIP